MTQRLYAHRCIFCKESEDPSTALAFLGTDWPYGNRVLRSGQDAFAVPGYGPQVFPYVLVVTRRHVISLAQCNTQERQGVLELLGWLQRSVFRSAARGLTVFEHSGCSNMHSCLEHFHLHVIDGAHDLGWAIKRLISCKASVSAETGLVMHQPYLLAGRFSPSKGIEALVAPRQEKEDQFFRRALARNLGEHDWDWREGRNMDYMLRTMERAYGTESGAKGLVPRESRTVAMVSDGS